MGDLYQPRNAAELRDQILRDVRLAALDSNVAAPPVEPGTDWFFMATAVANVSILGFANIAQAEDDTSELTATGAELDKIRQGMGLPEVPPTSATGKIVLDVAGTVTVATGTEFVYPNGLRGIVINGPYVNPSDGDEVDVQAVDTGANTNLAADQVVRFRSPPVNLGTEAKVSRGSPLTGGTDAESDERKRDRIMNVRKNKPAGQGADSNWARIRQLVLDALGSVVDCYVYPALGGPSSCKIVPVKDFDLANNDFSRALSSVAVTTIRNKLHDELGIPEQNVVQTVVDQNADFTVLIEIPNAAIDGASGLGWTDADPWPSVIVADANKVTISASPTNYSITVTAATTTSPIAGQTHIAWWSPVDRLFYQALVTAVSGGTGAWVLTLDRPLVSKNGTGPAFGDYVCPAAQNLDKYGAEWVNMFRTLGPGENTTDTNRLPRAKRHPLTTAEDPCAVTNAVLANLARKFEEITDYEFGVKSPATPTVPALTATAPNCLIPRHFAVYPLS